MSRKWFLLIALIILCVAKTIPCVAQEDSLPAPVREAVDRLRGTGIAKPVGQFQWGDATIYQIEIDKDGVPALDLEIAQNGKVIRVDQLQETPEDGKPEDGTTHKRSQADSLAFWTECKKDNSRES
ncbi:MAG: hypothetical protein JO076_14025 [Verrucomicrobia bacterium]|nr:hypothetical protein [Verrucomicrobiota bacterium]